MRISTLARAITPSSGRTVLEGRHPSIIRLSNSVLRLLVGHSPKTIRAFPARNISGIKLEFEDLEISRCGFRHWPGNRRFGGNRFFLQ